MARLGWAEEVFYRRLMSVVDDFGRYWADAGLLRAACYPRQLNKVSDSDVGKWLTALVEAALVRVYPAKDGERYLELLDFRQQVRAKESKFPAPDGACVADAKQTPSSGAAHAPVFVDVSVSVDEGVPRKRGKRPQVVDIPPDFGVSERVRAWAAEKGFTRLDEHLDAFKRKAAAKAYRYADWDAAFMEAVREDWAKLGKAPSTPVEADKTAQTRQYLAEQEAHAQKAVAPPAEVLAKLAELKGRLHA
jgi:hypothetical protein